MEQPITPADPSARRRSPITGLGPSTIDRRAVVIGASTAGPLAGAPALSCVIGVATAGLPRPSILIAQEPDGDGPLRWVAHVKLMHLLAPPPSMFAPAVLWRVWRGGRQTAPTGARAASA